MLPCSLPRALPHCLTCCLAATRTTSLPQALPCMVIASLPHVLVTSLPHALFHYLFHATLHPTSLPHVLPPYLDALPRSTFWPPPPFQFVVLLPRDSLPCCLVAYWLVVGTSLLPLLLQGAWRSEFSKKLFYFSFCFYV